MAYENRNPSEQGAEDLLNELAIRQQRPAHEIINAMLSILAGVCIMAKADEEQVIAALRATIAASRKFPPLLIPATGGGAPQ